MGRNERPDWMAIAENHRKALREMQANWSGMVEQSKQKVEEARVALRKIEQLTRGDERLTRIHEIAREALK